MGLEIKVHFLGMGSNWAFWGFYYSCFWKEHYLALVIWINFGLILCTSNFMRFDLSIIKG